MNLRNNTTTSTSKDIQRRPERRCLHTDETVSQPLFTITNEVVVKYAHYNSTNNSTHTHNLQRRLHSLHTALMLNGKFIETNKMNKTTRTLQTDEEKHRMAKKWPFARKAHKIKSNQSDGLQTILVSYLCNVAEYDGALCCCAKSVLSHL